MTDAYSLSADAKDDLKEIWKYIADNGTVAAADRVIERVFSECAKLGDSPELGHFRDDLLDRRHKFWSVWSYLIVYRWEPRPIQVIAVVHGARNLGAFLGRRKPNGEPR